MLKREFALPSWGKFRGELQPGYIVLCNNQMFTRQVVFSFGSTLSCSFLGGSSCGAGGPRLCCWCWLGVWFVLALAIGTWWHTGSKSDGLWVSWRTWVHVQQHKALNLLPARLSAVGLHVTRVTRCPSAWTQGGWLQGMGSSGDKRQNCGLNFVQTTFLCRVASDSAAWLWVSASSFFSLSSCRVRDIFMAPLVWLGKEKGRRHWVSSALWQLPKFSLPSVVPQVLSGIPKQG